jgi:glycosyltransferase involved in cell wall biosynthesis
MHILLVHQNFAAIDEPGGTRHHEMARYLTRLGHRVTVVTSPVSYLTGTTNRPPARFVEQQEQGGVTILRAYTYPALHRSFFHRVLSFFSFMVSSLLAGIQVKEVDLVWGTSPPIFQGISAWALARLKGAPFLFEVRDLWPAFAIQVGVLRQPALIRASEWLERFLYQRAERVIVNSPGFIQHVQSHGARRVELVPNGADLSMFDPQADGADFRHKHGLEGKYVALYAGAHGMSNDLGILLEAAALLKEQPEIAVVLLGDGKEKPALQAQAGKMGLKNVHFIPPVPKNEMGAALAASDACIAILKPIPLYGTVYPNKVFDYMAAGKPVILAIGGVIREVIEQAGAGIPVTPGSPEEMAEAVLRLARAPQNGQVMGLQGRQYLQDHFNRPALAEKLSDIFQDALQNKESHGRRK